MIGGAILPSILHQDPRYFYQGTGTKKSRALHALSTSFICKITVAGSRTFQASADISPRAPSLTPTIQSPIAVPGLVFSTTFIDIAADMANGVIQEFVLRKLTSTTRSRHQSDAGSN